MLKKMKEEHYSALWVLAPLCATLVALTGGMLFRGWFARDFALSAYDPILIGAFIIAVVIAVAVVGGYLGVLRRKVRPDVLWFSLVAALFFFFCALTIGCAIDGATGHYSSLVLAAFISLFALFFGVLLKRRLARV